MVKFNESSVCRFLMNIPLLVSGQALDVLRVAVGGARDPCCRHPCGSCASRRRHLHAEVREDPDHPRAVQRTAERVCVRVCECSLSSGRASHSAIPLVTSTSCWAILALLCSERRLVLLLLLLLLLGLQWH